MHGGWPASLDAEIAKAVAKLEKAMGKKLGDPADPLLVSRALRRQVLDAGDDGHRPQPRPQRRVGRRPGQADRRRALRLRHLPALHRHVRPHRARRRRPSRSTACSTPPRSGTASRPTPTISADTLRRLCERYKDVVREHTGRAFPQKPMRPTARRGRGGVQELERATRHRVPRPRAHRATTSAPP